MEKVPNTRLNAKIWSYVEKDGMLSEDDNTNVSSWKLNCPMHDVHVVSYTDLKSLVPDKYLPEKFDAIQDPEEKGATAGIALVRKYGGIYLSPRMMVNTNMDWAHKAFDLNSDHFFACGTETDLEPVVMAAPVNSPMLNRLHSTMVRKNMTPAEAYKDLHETRNKETKHIKKKNKIKMFDPPMVYYIRDHPDAKTLPQRHSDLFYIPANMGRGTPGSAIRHLHDKNTVPRDMGRTVKKSTEPEKDPGIDEKVPALLMALFLLFGAGVLVYKTK
jgi:hypothetical protein